MSWLSKQVSERKSEHISIKLFANHAFSSVTVPGGLLQIFAVLRLLKTAQGVPLSVFGSIIVSSLTTGFASAIISYDFDTNPVARREVPDFFGYVPDDGDKRMTMLVCMTLNGALLFFSRCIGASLLLLAKKRYFFFGFIGEIGLYLAYKLARGDFLYWVPIDGVGGVLAAIGMRVSIKLVTDFCCVMDFRGKPSGNKTGQRAEPHRMDTLTRITLQTQMN